ncbi:DUF6283 family protein [Nocardia brasiliensis]|uniref:DUF6283 family protein n=1 Tax=Nocardia brasiliensis TaxID=37326 RepID=UPI0024545BB9|nr:DUF6283 family protein [Nocardia brasiliensis]
MTGDERTAHEGLPMDAHHESDTPPAVARPLPRRRNGPCKDPTEQEYECPWVVATRPGQFPRERYEALATTTGSPGNEAGLDRLEDLDATPMFACHRSTVGREQACAGWLAAVGWDNLKIRIAAITGKLDRAALEPGPGWPPLHGSYQEMMDAKIIESATGSDTESLR